VQVFHAGTASSDQGIVSAGGRVLAVAARADTLQGALTSAYAVIDEIEFEGKTYRRDIGHRFVFIP
jgi:phosphoribosylamine--glycine ligase / phosphoribosylformylglycinamidine cyclo-ligase